MFVATESDASLRACNDPHAAFPLAVLTKNVAENSRLGFRRKNATLHLDNTWSNTDTALGIEAILRLEGIRSRYSGKERDGESGLDNFGARYDSSWMGRFMTPDWSAQPQAVPYAAFSDPQTLNLYGYVRNNPLRWTDPDGHCEVVCVAVIVGSILVGSAIYEFMHTNSKALDQGIAAGRETQKMYDSAIRGEDGIDKKQDAALDSQKKALAGAMEATVKATQIPGTSTGGDVPASVSDVVGAVIGTVVNTAVINSAEKSAQDQTGQANAKLKQLEDQMKNDGNDLGHCREKKEQVLCGK